MARWPYAPPETVHAALRAAVVTTIARAPEGVPVLITGCTAQPGPGGPLTGPFSGAPCVWHRTLFFGVLTGWKSAGPGAQRYYHAPAHLWTSDYAMPEALTDRRYADERSPQPFVVRDSTGSITVDTPVTQVQSRTLTSNRIDTGHDGRPKGTCVEWVIGPDQPVELLGAVRKRPDGSLVLVADAAGVAIVSTLTGRLTATRDYAITGRVPEELIKTRTDRLLASPGGLRKLYLRSFLLVGLVVVVFIAVLVALVVFL